jgi:hypothetical protein
MHQLPVMMILASAGMFVSASQVNAELIAIPAAAFIERCTFAPCAIDADDNVFDKGVLKTTNGSRFFAPVSFPKNGDRVCSFSLVYQDLNAADPLDATLFRKQFELGENADNNPITMATVQSASGASPAARKVTARDINSPVIKNNTSFYYVEVFAPEFNLNFLGVQIDVRPTCPAP